MDDDSKPKYETIYDYLVRGIESGLYRAEVRLPSERGLAEKLNVNVATVRRAFRDLVAAGVVEKRVGDGTYLRKPVDSRRSAAAVRSDGEVNLLLSTYQGPVQDEVAELALAEAARRGGRCRVVRLEADGVVPFIRTAIRFRQMTMVLGDGLLSPAAQKEIVAAAHRFVVLANRLDHLGIPSVVGDDHHGIRMIVDRLRELGHERIALLHNGSGHPIENVQVAVWRAATRGASPEVRAAVPAGAHPVEYAYRAVRASGPEGAGYSALVCLNEELARGALAALAESGVEVPGGCSVVAVGDTSVSRFAVPALTALNPNLAEHVRQGFELLDRNRENPDAPERLRVVEPTLVLRQSDAPFVPSAPAGMAATALRTAP